MPGAPEVCEVEGEPDGPVPFHYPADDIAYDLLGEAPAGPR